MYTFTGTVVEVTEHEQFRIERTDGSRYVQVLCVCVCGLSAWCVCSTELLYFQ